MSDPRVLAPGTLLNQRYEIVALVGRGGMGAVYQASDRRLPTATWAIKEMWAERMDAHERDAAAAQFHREATLLAGLAHPTLPRVSDFFTENGRQYLVMEMLEGETLEARVMRDGPLDVDQALRWAARLADALAWLHERPAPVIFRDVKPPNVMVVRGGGVKLIDFGIARIYTSDKERDTVPFGTPGFAAPEQYGRAQSDPRVDVYGLGATLHYLLTARDPAETVFRFAPPSTIRGVVPAAVDDIVMRAVALEPEGRFSSMRAMEAALNAVIATSSSPPGASASPPPLPAPPRATVPLPPPVHSHLAVAQSSPALSSSPALPAFDTPSIDFGRLRRGEMQRLNVRIQGDVDGSLTSSARRWLRVEPRRLKGRDPIVQIVVNSGPLKEGKEHHGLVTLRVRGGDAQLPVRVSIEPTRVSLLSVLLAALLTVGALVPLLGLLSALLFAFQYFSCPLDERPALRPFAIATVALALCNGVLVTLAVLVVRTAPQWVPWLHGGTS